jgi:hypothetical protein
MSIYPPVPFRRLRSAGVRHLSGTGPIPGGPGLVQPPILAPFDQFPDPSQSCEDNPTIAASRPDLPPWIYPPTNWENIDQDNYALVPAIGSTVIIISYVVPPGRNGVIKAVANNFVGGGWVEGTGDIIWRILVDGTPPPGATSYDSILASLGNPASPTGIAGFRIFENQVLTLVAFNNPAGPNGGVVVAGQRVGARFVGWNYPTDIEESDIWI